MMTGTVVNRCPTVPLVIRGPNGQETTVEAMLDTGFNGFLSLPASAIVTLGVPFRTDFRAGLADGTIVRLAVHAAVVIWNGAERDIEALVIDRSPLLGTALLDEHELTIRFTDDGLITIEPL